MGRVHHGERVYEVSLAQKPWCWETELKAQNIVDANTNDENDLYVAPAY